jgi:hypothetical protein
MEIGPAARRVPTPYQHLGQRLVAEALALDHVEDDGRSLLLHDLKRRIARA